MTEPRWIEYLPLTDLTGAHRNPKAHDQDRIAASITRFGYADAVILDERTGRLVAGHGRVAELGWRAESGQPAPDGVRVEGGVWLVPVQRGWSSATDEDAEAFLVAHNRVGEVGGWDERLLAETLEELRDTAPDAFEVTGFTSADLDRLLAELDPGDAPDEAGDAELSGWETVTLTVPEGTKVLFDKVMLVLDGEQHERFERVVRVAADKFL